MIAFKVRLNGKTLYVVGQPDASILSTTVSASTGKQNRRIRDHVYFHLGGLSHETAEGYREHFRYKCPEVNIGDTLEIEIVDTDEIDTPTKRFRSDREVQESPYTEKETRDMRYQYYLALKEEFENGQADDSKPD